MDGDDLSKLELSILKDLYRNRGPRKIAKILNTDHEPAKENLSDLSSKGYVKYNVGILKDKYKPTEKGLNILIQKDASVRKSITSNTPLQED